MLQFSLKKLRFINYFLIALIVITSLFTIRAYFVFLADKGKDFSPDLPTITSVDSAAKQKDIMHYASIVTKNPFGSPMKFQIISSSVTAEPIEDIKEIPLNDLTLIGTVVGPKDLSYAVFQGRLESSKNSQEVFALGKVVYDYGTLTEVLTDSVKMRKNGKTFTLEMPKEKIRLKNNTPRKNKSSNAPFVKKIGKRDYELDRRQVQNSIENPERILTDARLLPNFINGKQEGFTITEVKPGGLYESLGLRNGDILLKVNNLEISKPEVAIQAMSTIRGTNNVNLDIIRNSKNMSLKYHLK